MFGGPGLGRDLHARDRPLLLGELFGTDHQIRELSRDLRRDRAPLLLRGGGTDVGQAGSFETVHQIRRHHHAGVGHRRGDQRVLQRCHRDVFLPHARHPNCCGVDHRTDGRFGNLQWNGRRWAVESERVGGAAQCVRADPDAQFHESGIARAFECVPEGGRRSVSARCSAIVLQRRGAVGQGDRAGGGQLRVIGDPGLQCRRGRDHLERGSGWVAFGDGAIRQRRGRIVAQLLPGVALRLAGMGSQQVGVIGRRGHHRQNLPGGRLQSHHRAPAWTVAALLEGRPRGLLNSGDQGGFHVAAARIPAGEEIGKPPPEQPLIGAVEDQVLGPLKTVAREPQRVEARHRRVQERVRVDPQVPVSAVG